MTHKKIDASLAGEICLGEVNQWYTGVCTLRNHKGGIRVYGEAGHPIGTIYPDGDLEEVAETVNKMVKQQHEQL